MATETVFKYLVNKAAFIDGITLSVWTEKKPVVEELVDVEQKPILTSKSIYARYVSGKSPLTGNPVEIWYGKVPKFQRVPNCQMRMRSESLPLSGAQVNETVRLVFPDTERVQTAKIELTFDLKGVSVNQLFRSAIHKARSWTDLSDLDGRNTTYLGAPSSLWQIRIYDKAAGVVRLEVVLRRAFLMKFGIDRPDAAIGLRSLQLSTMFSLHRFSKPKVMAVTKSWEPEWREFACDWERYGGLLQRLPRMLGLKDDEIEVVLPLSRFNRTLLTMQRSLVW